MRIITLFLCFPVSLQDLPNDLQIHYIVVNEWASGVDAPQNVVLISIPSVLDPSLAPPGKHVLHAYTPGTEPYALWEGLNRNSAAYRQLKAQRAEVNSFLVLLFSFGLFNFCCKKQEKFGNPLLGSEIR